MALIRAAGLALMAAAASAQPMTIEDAGPGYVATVAFAEAAAAHPALDALLRAEADAALAGFKGWAAANDDPTRPYTFALADQATFVSPRYLSLLRTVDFYTGGAHGNRGVQARTWDAEAGAFVGIEAFVKGPEGLAALSQVLRAAIAAQVHGGAVAPFWREAVDEATAPTPEALGNFTLAPGEDGGALALDFHYAPYEVASYADGAPVVRVERAVFAAWLTAEGVAVFGR